MALPRPPPSCLLIYAASFLQILTHTARARSAFYKGNNLAYLGDGAFCELKKVPLSLGRCRCRCRTEYMGGHLLGGLGWTPAPPCPRTGGWRITAAPPSPLRAQLPAVASEVPQPCQGH